MKTLVAFILLFATTLCSGQCKYEKKEIDDFTKDLRVTTKARVVIKSAGSDAFYFRRVGDSYFVDISSTMPNSVSGVAKDNLMMLMLENDSVLELPAAATYTTSAQFIGTNMVTRLDATYIIEKEQLQMLVDSPLAKMRLYFFDAYDDINFGNSAAKRKITTAVSCLLSATN